MHIKVSFFLLASIFTFACSTKSKEESHPNVIYILADDLGYGDIHVFNPNGKILTPNIDQLAREGMLFTEAHTTSAVCTPTRYGIMTGRYNWRSTLKQGVINGKSAPLITPERTTVASMLQKQGYYTGFIGKWHLGWNWGLKSPDQTDWRNGEASDFSAVDFAKPVLNSPNTVGFNFSYALPASLDMAPYVYLENDKVTALPDTATVSTTEYGWWREGPTGSDFVHEEVTPHFFNKANSFIQERAKSTDPFFLYLALPSPHTPILPTNEWAGKSNLNPYADFVMMIDHYVGELLKTLKMEGLEENTLVIFTSDNGCSPFANFELLGQHGHSPNFLFRGHKADLFEGGHHVPFIARWPKGIAPGRQSDQLICTTDLFATLAEITGYSLNDNEGEDSFSMLPVFMDENQSIREAVVHHSVFGNFSIRKGKWKLLMTGSSGGWSFPRPDRDTLALDTLPPIQLYDLSADIGETQNVYDQHPEIVNELKALLIKYIQQGRSNAGNSVSNDGEDEDWPQIGFVY